MGKKRVEQRKKRQTKGQIIALVLVAAMAVSLVAYFSSVNSGPVTPQGTASPSVAEGYIDEGNRAYDAGNYAEAIRAYERALPGHGQDPGFLTDLGTAYYYKKPSEPDKAIAYYDQALAADPGFPNALFNKGIVLMEGLGKPAEALPVWEKLLSLLQPNDPQATRVREFIAQAKAATGSSAATPLGQSGSANPSGAPVGGSVGGSSRLSTGFGR